MQLGRQGSVINGPQIFGESLMVIGQVMYKSRIVGWETVDGWPCLKIEGTTARIVGGGTSGGFSERSEVLFSPAAGRIVKATLSFDGARTALRWIPTPPAKPLPVVPPTSEGITPAFPHRVLVEVAPGWRRSLTTLTQETLSGAAEMRRRHWIKADAGEGRALLKMGLTQGLEAALPRPNAWNTLPPIGLSLLGESGPCHVITDVDSEDLVYVLGHVSSGERHILLSAWDREKRHWAFQRKWLAGFTLPENGTKGLTVTAALDEDQTALLVWFSTGLLVCTDAITGDVRWTRLLNPSWMSGQQPALAALRVFDLLRRRK